MKILFTQVDLALAMGVKLKKNLFIADLVIRVMYVCMYFYKLLIYILTRMQYKTVQIKMQKAYKIGKTANQSLIK